MQVTACLLLLTWISVSAMAQNTINIGFIYSGSGQYITDGVRPAVGLAVELVNNRTDLLPEYQLNISYTRDSEVSAYSALSTEAVDPLVIIVYVYELLVQFVCVCVLINYHY